MLEEAPLEDAELVALVRDGSADSFAEIVRRYQAPLMRYLLHLTGGIEVAQDLAQETFLNAYKSLMKDGTVYALKPWLYRIATNQARQYHRRRRLITFIPFVDEVTAPAQEVTPGRVEDRLAVEEALGRVGPARRTCLLLHYVEGFKYADIAAILGTTEEAVRKRVARGSLEFKRFYQEGSRADEV